MSFFDVPYIVAGFAVFLLVVIVCNYVFVQVSPAYSTGPNAAPVNITNRLNTSWNSNVTFFANSYQALFVLFMLVSIILTALISTHPVVLAVWLLFNLVSLVVYDFMDGFLQTIKADPMNAAGVMNNAIDFYHSGVPKLIPVASFLMAAVMLGKRAISG